MVFSWFLSLMSNEFRQFLLAWKNNDVNDSFLTTTIAGNMVDLMSYLLFLIGFILHIASFYVYGDDYPQGPSVINPQFNDSEFTAYCPFYLPKLLVSAQECFHDISYSDVGNTDSVTKPKPSPTSVTNIDVALIPYVDF